MKYQSLLEGFAVFFFTVEQETWSETPSQESIYDCVVKPSKSLHWIENIPFFSMSMGR